MGISLKEGGLYSRHFFSVLTFYLQEISLFNAAFDGDTVGLSKALGIGVPVDFLSPVREITIYCCCYICSLGWLVFTIMGI